ncbi:uncharacterized protein LOC133443783 isoform X2 [Cololabis saira]|uniref:uncharacterized protein LOC133443783 isoform X2 n=1 Tax=Cololabis saira TaxID=129043 RepID=UPI002AD21B4B|nr:uncharacterized protein LOC133443783 isoform X2 [Cololabis saira]
MKRKKRRRRRSNMHKRYSKPLKKFPKACEETLQTCTTLESTPSFQTVTTPVEVDSLHCDKDELEVPQLSKPPKIKMRKIPRRKRRFGKLSKKKKVTSAASVVLEEEERKETEHQNVECKKLKELEAYPLRRKMERWDIKPVISECGRILVPHGAVDFDEQVKSLKDNYQPSKDECLEKMQVDAPVNVLNTVEMEQKSSGASEMGVDEMEATHAKDVGNHHPQCVAEVDLESISKQSEDGGGSVPLTLESSAVSPRSSSTDPSLPQEVQEKKAEKPPERCLPKSKFLLSRLKSVLSRRKGKRDFPVTVEKAENIPQDSVPFFKQAKVDSDTEGLDLKNTTTKGANLHDKEVSKTVDPDFAYALGLTPKEFLGKVQSAEEQSTRFQPLRVLQRAPLIFPRSRRIKTLKKHQGWLHFQTPGCITSETFKNTDCTSDISNRKTVKRKVKSACSSAEALNLLADLALGVRNDQGPPQPNPAFERKPEESLKNCDFTKGLTDAQQESVLHALLRTPPARPIQTVESPAPTPLVGDSKLVSEEHTYSLPPSSSPPLGLSGSPFQVTPLSGSTGVLHHHHHHHHHHQTKDDDGVQRTDPSFIEEDISEDKRSSEHPHRHRHRRRLRRCRTFALKDGSIQVTRQWRENYDFRRDSRFSCHPKDKVVVRALHGPWDFSIQDTNEEVRLIFHMWIGLFYSRSTDRFFHMDSCLKYPYSEVDALKMAEGMVSGATGPEVEGGSTACPLSSVDASDPLASEPQDLSKKDGAVTESVVLDLSLRNSKARPDPSELQAYRNLTRVPTAQMESFKAFSGPKLTAHLQDASKLQCEKKNASSMEIIKALNDVGRRPKSKNDASTQKEPCLEHGNSSSFQGDGTIIPQQEEDGSGPIKQETVPRPLGFSKAPNECNKGGIHRDISVNSETTKKCLAQKDGKDSSISVTDTEKDDKKEGVTVHTDELELKAIQMRNDPCPEGNVNPSLEKIHPCDGSANKELGILLSKNGLGKEKLSRQECKVVSPDQIYPLNGNADCSTGCTEFRENDHKREDGLKDHPLPNMSDGPLKEDLSPTQTEEQPPLADSTKVTWSDLCGNPFLNISSTPSEIMLTFDNSAAEKSFRKDICLGDKAGYQKATLPMSDGSSCSSKEPCTELHSPHTKGSVQARDENEVSDFSFDLGSIGHNDQDSKLTHTDLRSPKEPFQNQPHPTEGENNMPCATKTTLKPCKMSDKVDKQREIVIPFIGIDTSGMIIVQSQGKIEEAVGNQEAIPFISETTNSEVVQPSEDSTLTPVRDETAECSPKISPLDVNESQKPVVLDSVFGDSWPTPAVSEKMDDNMICSSPSRSTSVFINKFPSRSSAPVTEEPLFPHKVQTSTFKAEPNLHQGLTSDLELRTLRVVQKLNEFLSTSKHMDNQKEAADKRSYPHQRPNLSTKPVSTCSVRDRISVGYKTRKASKRRTPMRSISSSQGPRTKSPEDVQPQHFSDKMEEILGVKLQLKNSASSVPQHRSRSANEQPISTGPDCYSYIPFISAESVQDVRKTPSQSNLNHGARSYSQRPVMAVKPSKSEESQGHCFWRDPNGSNGLIGSYTGQSSISLETRTKERSDGLNDENCDVHEFSSLITSRLSNDGYSNSTSDAEPFALQNPPHQCLGKNISKFVMVPSLPLFVEPYDSAESYPRALDENHILLTHNLIPKEEDINQNDYSDKFLEYHEEEGIREDSCTQQPETTLVCTVTNTGWREPSLLEQLSRRCIQDDPTQGSIEQECLIFSEQMKNLLKKKKELVCQQDIHGSVRLPCTSPVTVNFSSLEEQDDSPDFFDESIVGQKIEIDLSDRKNLRDSTEGDRSLHSQRPGNPMEHPGVSDMTAECARLYQAKMDDICSVKKVPSRQRGSGMYQGHPRSGPSKHFDFCGQMKKELDETFRSNLNAVVKKSCRTKYRFYLLVTADDVFFEETKALLEAEGHIAVQPSEFFLAEDCSSSLFIILRNEDIAEHISEVPDLLKLKMSPGVQFAGIDEPDDIVNLTHQELFTHGGFIMVNRAVLETLSLCNMKAISDILLELGRSGKWKWILHYKDSRRWKENARLSKEDNEKKQFLFWGKDTGMLEVLPYHDCDLVTKDEPDYLACLLRLQVQNVTSRYIIFITDTRDSALEENGILTLTLTNFLAKFSGQSD